MTTMPTNSTPKTASGNLIARSCRWLWTNLVVRPASALVRCVRRIPGAIVSAIENAGPTIRKLVSHAKKAKERLKKVTPSFVLKKLSLVALSLLLTWVLCFLQNFIFNTGGVSLDLRELLRGNFTWAVNSAQSDKFKMGFHGLDPRKAGWKKLLDKEIEYQTSNFAMKQLKRWTLARWTTLRIGPISIPLSELF